MTATPAARRLRDALAALIAVVALSGCAAISERFGPHEASTGTADPADATFAQMMIPHHEQAIEMARLAPSRSTDPDVLELAREIEAAQQPEIDLMTRWLTAWGADVVADHSDHGMAGMASDDNLAALAASTGGEFDRRFLTLMVAHHEGALTMAEPVRSSADPAVKKLAAEIVATQSAEIARMRTLLAEVPAAA